MVIETAPRDLLRGRAVITKAIADNPVKSVILNGLALALRLTGGALQPNVLAQAMPDDSWMRQGSIVIGERDFAGIWRD